MRSVTIELNELEAQTLEEFARNGQIPIEEAARRCVIYVLRELLLQSYLQLRSQMFWEHWDYLKQTLRKKNS